MRTASRRASLRLKVFSRTRGHTVAREVLVFLEQAYGRALGRWESLFARTPYPSSHGEDILKEVAELSSASGYEGTGGGE